jgi:hypothetical protein
MAITDKFFPGTTVSRHLPTGERSWDEAVYQSGKPVLDAELNLSQEVVAQIRTILMDREVPSGWLRGPRPVHPYEDFRFPAPGDADFASDAFRMTRRVAVVAGMPVVVEYTGTTDAGDNSIQLDPATVYGGTPPTVKRTDFVFLEVFRALVQAPHTATATVTVADPVTLVDGDTLNIGPGVGTVMTARNPLTGAPDEFLIDPANAINTAANLRDAINDPANSFTGICTAALDVTVPNQVNLSAVAAGTDGNLNNVSTSVPASLVLSGAAFAGGTDPTPNAYPTMGTIYRQGNRGAPAGVNLPNEMIDPTVVAETAARVQVQYRIRITGASEAVNFKTEADGFSNADVLAQGTTGAPVVNYPFLPADGATTPVAPIVSSPAAYGKMDRGLFVAGDGTQASATALGTVDGFSYAIPICFVFRRNDAYDGGAGGGFDPLNNANGALPSTHGVWVNPSIGISIPADTSDRPDGHFHDAIVETDVLDLRKQVTPGGVDLKAELERQMTLLLDNNMRTWAIDAQDKQELGAGSGDVSWRFLVCNEVGRSAASGGVAPISGDTTRGDTVADFDHVRRRFADQPVVERRVFPVSPQTAEPGIFVTQVNPGHTGWYEGDVINIDLSALNATGLGDWSDASQTLAGGVVDGFWPPGTKVTAVLVTEHDDGNYTAIRDRNVQIDTIVGIGTPHIEIALGPNNQTVTGGIDPTAPGYPFPNPMYFVTPTTGGNPDFGSRRRIFVELEITYPAGSGTTDTPHLEDDAQPLEQDPTVYVAGSLLENDTTQRPLDLQSVVTPKWREGKREMSLEYVAGDQAGPAVSGTPITENGTPGWSWPVSPLSGIVSSSPTEIRMPRRVFGSNTTLAYPNITDQNDTLARDTDTTTTEYGSSSRLVKVDGGGVNGPLSGAGSTLCNVEYFAQDPIPNYGAAGGGYQVAVYYRSAAPQTLGVREGAVATWQLPDPVGLRPLVMSRDLWTAQSSVGSFGLPFPYANPSDQIPVNEDAATAGEFPAEWYLSATAEVSIGDFAAEVGMLNLHQVVAVDPNSDMSFSDLGIDPEFRAQYKVSDPSAYRPTAMAQPLSNVATHKVWMPFLAYATEDSVLWREGEVLLVVVTRYGLLDADNTITFADADNRTCVALYRTQGILLLASE